MKLAENIIAHPDDPKYQKFKPTNATINRLLVEPRGTLEFAVAVSGARLAVLEAGTLTYDTIDWLLATGA